MIKGKHSFLRELKKENKINNEFEAMLSHLTLEEIIALKLELSAKACGGKFYGNYLLKATKYIVDEAIVRFAMASCATTKGATQFLGVSQAHYNAIVRSMRLHKERKE